MAEETKLTSAEFAAKIKAKYPQYAAIPDDELTEKIVSKHPEYADKVTLAKTAIPAGTTPDNLAAVAAANQTDSPYPMVSPTALPGASSELPNVTGSRPLTPEEQAQVNEEYKKGMPMLAANLASEGSASFPLLARLGITGGAAGLTSAAAGGDKGDVAISTALGAGGEFGGAASKYVGEKIAPLAPQALARILRLGPKAFQFGREPAEEVLTRGLATGNLKEMVGNIGEASKQVTSELNTTLKNAPGTVDVFQAGTDASKSIPNPAAANRFEQTVLDAADKLGLKNLDKLTNAEANALKQEVAKQARFVEGDLRPSVASAAKTFGGKVKDGIIANAPKAKDLLESSANLTEASKAGEHAVRMEKAGRTESGLSAVDIKKPATYPRLATDTITGVRMLFKMANMLKDQTSVSNALRLAFQMVYPGAANEE